MSENYVSVMVPEGEGSAKVKIFKYDISPKADIDDLVRKYKDEAVKYTGGSIYIIKNGLTVCTAVCLKRGKLSVQKKNWG